MCRIRPVRRSSTPWDPYTIEAAMAHSLFTTSPTKIHSTEYWITDFLPLGFHGGWLCLRLFEDQGLGAGTARHVGQRRRPIDRGKQVGLGKRQTRLSTRRWNVRQRCGTSTKSVICNWIWSYAESVGATHYHTSAKLNRGVAELFLEISKSKSLTSRLPLLLYVVFNIRAHFPSYWRVSISLTGIAFHYFNSNPNLFQLFHFFKTGSRFFLLFHFFKTVEKAWVSFEKVKKLKNIELK